MLWSASLQSEKRLKLDARPKKMHKESADARLRKLLVASKKKSCVNVLQRRKRNDKMMRLRKRRCRPIALPIRLKSLLSVRHSKENEKSESVRTRLSWNAFGSSDSVELLSRRS